jgi:hypothetical protein
LESHVIGLAPVGAELVRIILADELFSATPAGRKRDRADLPLIGLADGLEEPPEEDIVLAIFRKDDDLDTSATHQPSRAR